MSWLKIGCLLLAGLLGTAAAAAAPQPQKQESQQARSSKVCLMWQQPKPDEKRLTFPGRPEGVNVISPCWFHIINEQGEVTSIAERSYVRQARQSGMKIWPLVTNSFEPQMTARLLKSPEGRQKAAANLVRLAKVYELDGINIDFENIAARDRDGLTSFVTELSQALHKASMTVSLDLTAPMDQEYWSKCYDRKALAAQVDYIMLMSYDEHSPGFGSSGSVASIPWVQQGIENTLKDGVPANKMLLGMPLYMRLWSEKDGKTKGKTLHMPAAQSLWREKGVSRRWLADIGQYYYEYQEQGTRYRVWQEDARSLALKAALISRYDLAGAALWKKGVETPDVWPVLAQALVNADR